MREAVTEKGIGVGKRATFRVCCSGAGAHSFIKGIMKHENKYQMNVPSEATNASQVNVLPTRVMAPRLGQFPWSSALLDRTMKLTSAFNRDFTFDTFMRRLQEYEDNVIFGSLDESRHDLIPHTIRVRNVLCIEVEHPASQTITVTPKAINPLTTSDAQIFSSLLTAYRLADVLATEGLTGAAPRNPRRFPQSPELVIGVKLDPFDHLHDWVNALHEAKKIAPTSNAPPQQKLPYVEMLKAIRMVEETTKRGKILKNLLLATFHLDILNRARRKNIDGGDIPCLPDIPDSLDALMSGICEEDDTPDGGFDSSDMSWLKTTFTTDNVTHFRTPLQLALGISPLLLLLPINLTTRKHSKLAMIKYFRALGNERPESLRAVESVIWRVLTEAAVGGCAPLHIRSEIMKQIPWNIVDQCADADRTWFRLTVTPAPSLRSKSIKRPAPYLTVDHSGPNSSEPFVEQEFESAKSDIIQEPHEDTEYRILKFATEVSGEAASVKGCEQAPGMKPRSRSPRSTSRQPRGPSGDAPTNETLLLQVGICFGSAFTDNEINPDSDRLGLDQTGSAVVPAMDNTVANKQAFDTQMDFGNPSPPSSPACPPSRVSTSTSIAPRSPPITTTFPAPNDLVYQSRTATGKLAAKPTSLDFELRRKSAKMNALGYKRKAAFARDDNHLDIKRLKLMTSDQKEEIILNILKEPFDTDRNDGWILETDIQDHRVSTLSTNMCPLAPTAEKHTGTSINVWTDRGESEIITPCFHDDQDLNRLALYMEVCEKTYYQGMPHHVASPDQSMFDILPFDEYKSLDFHQLMKRMKNHHLIILDMPWKNLEFNTSGLRTLAPLDSVVSMHDLTISTRQDFNASLVHGRVRDLLTAAEDADGKFLNALSFPFASGETTTLEFSTDMAAWACNSGIVYTGHQAIPFGHVRWGLASTGGTMTWNHIDSDGLATFVDVRCGSKLWFVHKENEGKDSSISRFLDGKFSLTEPVCTLEHILLKPGTRLIMRPNTIHTVYTKEPSICHGGHFYATGSLASTLSSLVHSFICDQFITNVSHPETRILLRQIMHMIHRGVVLGLVAPEDPEYLHLPLLTSPDFDVVAKDNVLEILAICTLSIMGNVLDPRTYMSARHTDSSSTDFTSFEVRARETFDLNAIPSSERGEISYARAAGWETLRWFSSTYLVRNKETKRKIDLVTQYLVHFASSLVQYKREADDIGVISAGKCVIDSIVGQLDAVVEHDPLLIKQWHESQGYQLWSDDASDLASDVSGSEFGTPLRRSVLSKRSSTSDLANIKVVLTDLSGFDIEPTGKKFEPSSLGPQHGTTRLDKVFAKAKAKMGVASTDWARALFTEN